MYRIRIKTSPDGGTHKTTGQQEEYGLVRNLSAMQNAPQTIGVNNKMGAIPRDQANIEVEGGESVIGDVNQDGTMELMHFVGKRHSEGGIPVNIPEGSFIFSDTKSLTIKDPEVIEKIFNLPFKKGGYTPGEISKKYEINTYVEILKDENADPLAKRSAAEMLKKNKQKLGILAFIQESLKGFPDGIPAIAEDVLSTMGIDPNQMAQQFAPPQPEQGMGMGMGQQMMPEQAMGMPPQEMMPSMEGQGIPMSEDEDAMAGMMPEGPMVAPDQIPEQMMGRFGGTMLPHYEQAGAVSTPKCPTGYVWNERAKICTLSPYSTLAVVPNWATQPPIKQNVNPNTQAKTNTQKFKDLGYGNDFASQLEQRIREANKLTNQKRPPSLTTSGKYPSQEPLGDNSFAAQFKRNNPTQRVKAIEAQNKVYDAQREKAIAEGEKKEAARKKAEAEDRAKNPYKYSIPGFGSKSELDDFMSSGSSEYAAGDIFYKALLSMDPYAMLDAAEQIKDTDVPYSVGWLPWTNQDKIDDMYSILHQEAYKKLNENEKEKITTHYKVEDLNKRADNLIAKYEKLASEATDMATKQKYAEELNKFKRYKEYINSDDHKEWRKETENSRVVMEDTWLPVPGIGNPIQDRPVKSQDVMGPKAWLFSDTETLFINHGWDDIAHETDVWYDGPRFKTYLEVYDELTKAYDKENKTNIATIAPLANKGLTHTNERQGLLNWDRPEIESNVKTIAEIQKKSTNSPKVAKTYKPEYKSKAYPQSVFRVDTNEKGEAIWVEYTEDGAELPVDDKNIVNELNAAASKAENKPYAIKPASSGAGTIIEMLEQENKLNPTIKSETPASKKEGSTSTPRKSVVAPITPKKEAPKFENGITDDDFKKFEKFQEGGTVGQIKTIRGQQFRYGGMIDEQGKLRYSRGGSVLPKYNNAGTVTGPGDPPKEERVASGEKVGNPPVTVNVYKQVFTDPNGGAPTTIMIFRDAADESKIIARRNSETGQSYKPTEEITRASSTWVTQDNLNDTEKKLIADHWNNKPELYLNYINSKNQMYLNKDFRKKMFDTYTQGIKDEYVIPGKGKMRKADMYTGAGNEATRKGFQTSYGGDLASLSEEQMLDALFAQEERNRRLEAYGYGDVKGEQNVSTSGTGKQSDYVNARAFNMINNTYKAQLGDLDFSKGYRGQAAYLAYQRALLDNPEFQDYAEQLQTGVNDETAFGIKGKVSGIDNFNTNTTLEQKLGWKPKPPNPPPKPGMKQAYYCVEYTDGTKMVQTVDYKENEKPVQPTGDKVKNATQYDTLELANKNCEVPKKDEEIIPPKEIPQPDTWFTPDVINLATGIRQRVPHPNAVLRQMPQIYSGYDLNNPITQIAGATGLMRQQQDLAMNTMDPTTAFAAMAGQGYDALAKGIAGVEEKNVDTVNNYLGRIGALQYQYDAANLQGQRQFDVDTEVGKEEFARDLNKVDAQNALLYGTGWGNVQKDNALRVAYPNAWHANRITPDFSWSGVGRDPLGPDTSVTPGGSSGQTDCSGEYARAYNSVKNDATMDEDAKKDYAKSMMQACISQNNYRANQINKTQQQQYSNNLNSNVRWSQFGGTYTAPGAYDYEFGGTYFDDF